MTATLPGAAATAAPTPAVTTTGAPHGAPATPPEPQRDANGRFLPKAGEPDPAASTAPAGSTPEPLKIAPIKRLPGVTPRARSTNQTMAEQVAEARRAAEQPEADDVPGEEQDPNAPPKEPEAEAPKTGKYKLDGKEFATPEELLAHAERELKTSRNAQAAAAKNAQKMADARAKQLEAQFAQRLADIEARIVTPQTQAAQTDPNVQQFWSEISRARRASYDLQDPDARAREDVLTMYSIAQFIAEQMISDRDAKLDARLKPFEETQASSAEVTAADALFRHVAQFQAADGSPQFPEMLDEHDVDKVARIWYNRVRKLPAEDRNDPNEVVLAILAYRSLKQATAPPVQRPSPPPPPPAPRTQRAPESAVAPPVPQPTAPGAAPHQLNIGKGRRLPGGMTLPGVFGR